MKIIHSKSLAATLDALNEIFFYRRSLPKSQKAQIAKWIAGRQGLPGSYANMFAPTKYDFKKGIRLFTGECVLSNAAIGHILGEEACRVLILLNVRDADVQVALQRATWGMLRRLAPSEIKGRVRGMYCCGICTGAYWRHLAVGGLKNSKRRLVTGMRVLMKYRDGNGKWRRFPFYYTLLALSEINLPSAIAQMRYAAPVCERYLKHSHRNGKISQRRRALAERILEKC